MTVEPLDPFSEVVSKNRRWTPEWYGWVKDVSSGGTATGGSTDFLGLTDTPDTYVGQAGEFVRVNAGATGLEFAVPAGLSQPWIFISDFGAVGDNFTDDTAALNAAFASLAGGGGTVIFDRNSFCRITNTVTVGSAVSQTNVNIFCPYGQIRSGVRWDGGAAGLAVLFSKQKFARCIGLGIYNFGARGTTIGLGLGGPGGGNQTSGLVFDALFVSGFNLGVHAGSTGGAASEISFNLPCFQNCDTGFDATDFNSLDFLFKMVNLDNCGIGISTGVMSGFCVIGGSASFCGIDFLINGNSQHTYIGGGYRSEVSSTAVIKGNGLGIVTVESILTQSDVIDSINGQFGTLVVRTCRLGGPITLTGWSRYLEVSGCMLSSWDRNRLLPVSLSFAAHDLSGQVRFLSNCDGVFPADPIPDLVGQLGIRQNNFPTNPSVFLEPTIWQMNNITDNSITPASHPWSTMGVDWLALCHVRSLSEATLSAPTAELAPTPGRNLRVMAKFAGVSPLAFTFLRTVLIQNATGDPTVDITPLGSKYFKSDAGKPFFIANGADTADGAGPGIDDWYGYIIEVLTDTTALVRGAKGIVAGGRGPQFGFIGPGMPGIIGENEPNDRYMVAGITSDSNETFWVTNITPTGFNVHSSNAASTATVTMLIVR